MAATLILHTDQVRTTAHQWIKGAPVDTVVKFYPPKRTTPQNARFWAMLTDISKQVTHNGKKYTPDQWKALMMNACGYEVQFIEGLSGEPFPVGFKSSNLGKEQMGELMEFMSAYGAENNVRFNDN